MIVATTDPYGNPQCPICHEPMEREGEFCSPAHWEDFHVTVYEMGEVIIMDNYLTLEEQPWYGKHHG